MLWPGCPMGLLCWLSRHPPTEQLDRLAKKEYCRVLGRCGNRGFGGISDRLGRNTEPACHILGIFQVKVSPAPELGNDKVRGVQQPKTKPGLFKQHRNAITISGRHGDYRPPGHVLAKVRRQLMLSEELDERFNVPH